jgi:capsular exopolysaccharide synthesis family protein
MAQYDINLRDYWRIIRKRRTVILFTTALLALFSFVFAKLNEPIPIYSASSSVKFQRSTTVAGLVAESFSFSTHDEIATQRVIIRSYPIMEEVAKGLKLIDPNLSSEKIRTNGRLVSLINGLRSQVEVTQEGDTNIMNIRCTSTDPKLAFQLANMVARVYQKQMALERNHETRESRQFIEGQLKVVEARLREAEDRVKKFQEANQFYSVTGLANVLEGERRRLEGTLKNQRNQLATNELLLKQLRGIKALKGQSNERLFFDASSPTARLNNQLLDLQLKRDALLLSYTDEHPEVIETNRQIQDILDEMENELLAEVRIRKLQLEELEKQFEQAKKRAREVPEIGVLYQRLQQEVQVNNQVYGLLTSKLQEARIREAGLTSEVTIVRPAFEPTSPINEPSLGLNTIIGAIIGLVVGLIFAFLLETLDTSIGAIEDVEEFLGVPVVGIIPYTDPDLLFRDYLSEHPDKTEGFASEVFYRLVCHFMPRTPMAEAYRSLRTNMEFISLEKEGNTFVVTSSSPGEGKTNTVINLALAFAQTGKRTLLVSADLRRPTVYRIFGIDRDPGLTDVLLGNNEWRDVVRTVTDIMIGKFDMEDILLTPGLDNLTIMTCGPIPPNPAELLNSQMMKSFLQEVSEAFDVVLLDAPPVLPVTDAAIIGNMAHGTILVYQVGQVSRGALRRAKVTLDHVQAPVWGVVLNSLRAEVSPDLDSYKYSSSYYYYGYSEDEEYVAPEGFLERLRSKLWPFDMARAEKVAVKEEGQEGEVVGAAEADGAPSTIFERLKGRIWRVEAQQTEGDYDDWEEETEEDWEEEEESEEPVEGKSFDGTQSPVVDRFDLETAKEAIEDRPIDEFEIAKEPLVDDFKEYDEEEGEGDKKRPGFFRRLAARVIPFRRRQDDEEEVEDDEEAKVGEESEADEERLEAEEDQSDEDEARAETATEWPEEDLEEGIELETDEEADE